MVFHLLLSICLQFSLLLLQLLIFPVQIHRDADHDTQADDDKDDRQNHFTHDAHSCSSYSSFHPRSLLLPILELLPALRAILEVFHRRVAAVVADLRPLALLLQEPLLRTSCRSPRRILPTRYVSLPVRLIRTMRLPCTSIALLTLTSRAILCPGLPTLLEVEVRLLYRNALPTLDRATDLRTKLIQRAAAARAHIVRTPPT